MTTTATLHLTPTDRAAAELALRLHALWKALEAVPLPRLAAWAEAAWMAHRFGAEPWAVYTIRQRLQRARLAAPSEAERWARRHPAFFLDLLPAELPLAGARLGLSTLAPVREALVALAPCTQVRASIGRVRRPPAHAALLLAVEDLELLLVDAALEPSATAATALRRHLLGADQDARGWLDTLTEPGVAPWLWVWTGDPSGLVDQVRADLAARLDLTPDQVATIQSAITALLTASGLPADTTGAARRESRRAALQALAEALHAEGRRSRYGELVLFLAQLDGRLDEAALRVRLPRTVRGLDGLAWVRRSDWPRLRRHLSPVAARPRIGEAITTFAALP